MGQGPLGPGAWGPLGPSYRIHMESVTNCCKAGYLLSGRPSAAVRDAPKRRIHAPKSFLYMHPTTAYFAPNNRIHAHKRFRIHAPKFRIHAPKSSRIHAPKSSRIHAPKSSRMQI